MADPSQMSDRAEGHFVAAPELGWTSYCRELPSMCLLECYVEVADAFTIMCSVYTDRENPGPALWELWIRSTVYGPDSTWVFPQQAVESYLDEHTRISPLLSPLVAEEICALSKALEARLLEKSTGYETRLTS